MSFCWLLLLSGTINVSETQGPVHFDEITLIIHHYYDNISRGFTSQHFVLFLEDKYNQDFLKTKFILNFLNLYSICRRRKHFPNTELGSKTIFPKQAMELLSRETGLIPRVWYPSKCCTYICISHKNYKICWVLVPFCILDVYCLYTRSFQVDCKTHA